MTYDFDRQLALGVEDEQAILRYLAPDWHIEPASVADQRRGIDYHLTHRQNTRKFSIEIKSDRTASKTGNAFIETYSVFPDKQGWAHTCQADWIFYYLPIDALVYVFKPQKLRDRLGDWQAKYPRREIPNATWTTVGLLVPLSELEAIAYQTLTF
jgi:hypothetical protein